MDELNTYNNYPCRIMIVSNFVSIAIYFIGAFIIYQIGIIWLSLYIVFIIGLEIRLMKQSCTHCYYYGKYCAFGKGKISSLLFGKGDPEKFHQKQITWKNIIPDLLVVIIPITAGIVLLILDFNWLILVLLILLAVFAFAGNSIIRGSLACKYCKQRELGCPAEQLFNKKKK